MGMDHYTRMRSLGGSSGAFLAVDKQDATRQVVIKRLADDAQGLQELMTALRVRHANIVPFLESFLSDGSLYLVMRYEPGGDLEQHLEKCAAAKSAPSSARLLRWYTQLLTAVAHCHARHIIHRDIKPSNIFVSRDGDTLFLGDFGSAKTLDTHSITSTFVGSPMWLAPEVLLGRTYSYSADVWSLGCVFYEMAALQKPFACHSLAQLVKEVTEGNVAPLPANLPPALRHLLTRMLARDPAQRPTAAEALRMLHAAATLLSSNDGPADKAVSLQDVKPGSSPLQKSPPPTVQTIHLLDDVNVSSGQEEEASNGKDDSRRNAAPQQTAQTLILDDSPDKPRSAAASSSSSPAAAPSASRRDVVRAASQFATPPYARLNSAAVIPSPAPMPSSSSSVISAANAHKLVQRSEAQSTKTTSHQSTGVVVAVSPASSSSTTGAAAAAAMNSASPYLIAIPASSHNSRNGGRHSNQSSRDVSSSGQGNGCVTRLSSFAVGAHEPRAGAQTVLPRDARARSPGAEAPARVASGVGRRRRIGAATASRAVGQTTSAAPSPPVVAVVASHSALSPTRPRSRLSAGSKETTTGSEPRVVAKAPPSRNGLVADGAKGRTTAGAAATKAKPTTAEKTEQHVTPLVPPSQPTQPPPSLQTESLSAPTDGRHGPPQLIIISPQKAPATGQRRVRPRRGPTAATTTTDVAPLRRCETRTSPVVTPSERHGPVAVVHPASSPPPAVSSPSPSLTGGVSASHGDLKGKVVHPSRYHRPRPRQSTNNGDDALRPNEWLAARNEDMSAIENYLHQFRDYDDKVLLRLESQCGSIQRDATHKVQRTTTEATASKATGGPVANNNGAPSASPMERRQRRCGSPCARHLSPSPADVRRAGPIRQVSTKYAAQSRQNACSPFARQNTAVRHVAQPEKVTRQASERSPHSAHRAQHQANFARPAPPRTEQERQRSEEQRCAARARREAERSAMKAMIRHQRARARRPSRVAEPVAVEIRLPDNLRFTDSGAIRPLSRGQLEV